MRVALVALLLTGCTGISGMGGGLASVVREMAKDPASVCAFVGTPYGPVALARANVPGIKVTVANGTCTIERAGAGTE